MRQLTIGLQGKRKKSSRKPQGPKKVNSFFLTGLWPLHADATFKERAPTYVFSLFVLQSRQVSPSKARQERWNRRAVM